MSFSFKQLPLLIWCLSQTSLVKCSSSANSAAGSGGGVYGGRHSYSLSTFSPSGNIDQVVRAMRASVLGVPIVALSIPATTSSDVPTSSTTTPYSRPLPSQGGIYLSIPLRSLAASPFLLDDGTPRIVQLTSSLCIAHTGVGADGRALCDIATKIALDYRYIYGEEITLEEFLEGLADKVQEMTMRPGSRPFGCALLVGCLGRDDGCRSEEPTMYRVDPSGAVVLLNSFNHRDGFDAGSKKDVDQETIIEDFGRRGSVAFLGNWDPLRQKKDSIRSQLESQQFTDEEELQSELIDVARQTYIDQSSMSEESPSRSKGKSLNQPILFASFTREHGLQITRVTNLK